MGGYMGEYPYRSTGRRDGMGVIDVEAGKGITFEIYIKKSN